MDGSFKGLSVSDVFLTDYVAKKQWSFSGTDFKPIYTGGDVEYGKITLEDLPPLPVEGEDLDSYRSAVLYRSIHHQFFHIEGSTADNRDISNQSTITLYGDRVLGSKAIIISIARKCFGTNIEHGSLTLRIPSDTGTVVLSDKEGMLVASRGPVVGNIIYNQGLIIITNNSLVSVFDPRTVRLTFKSCLPIYTHNVCCKVQSKDLNYTYNPTAKSHIGELDFTPYITTVGLYNDLHELIAVAKLSKPIKKASTVNYTFNVRVDV